MSMPPSILDALDASTPAANAGRCKIGRWLDTVPTDEPGRDRLIAAFETRAATGTGPRPEGSRTEDQLAAIAHRLGHPVSTKTIGQHRNRLCRCYW